MTEYEYHLQRREGRTWRFCGSGPASLGTVRADFRGWREQAPDLDLRIVRRKVQPWTITDQSYTQPKAEPSKHAKRSDLPTQGETDV